MWIALLNVFTHLFLPAIMLFVIYRGRASSRTEWILGPVIVTGIFLLFMWKTGAWWWFGLNWPVVYLALYPLVVLISYRRNGARPWVPPLKQRTRAAVETSLGLGIMAAFVAGPALSWREYPAQQAVDLHFPLRGGTYVVVQGGGHRAVNHHFRIPAQKYAVDLLKLNESGVRASGLLPDNLEHYATFGEPVHAPCSGTVIATQSSLPDLVPPKTDPANQAGNYAVLHCEDADVSVLMAHLKKDSLNVQIGERVAAGQLVGHVGNSGNTSEPHLHIQAVSGRINEPDEIERRAEGRPMHFGGRFLVRNDRIHDP